jgi:hypothetical protein
LSKGYNYIYDQLVDSEDDIHGIISYSVYKRQKIQFIQDFKAKNNRDPDDMELQQFISLSTSETQLDFYRNQATALSEQFLNTVLQADLDERESYFSARVHAELNNIKPRHLLDVIKGALGSFLFVLLTGFLYFAVWSLSTSPKMVVEQVFHVKIISDDIMQTNEHPSSKEQTPTK